MNEQDEIYGNLGTTDTSDLLEKSLLSSLQTNKVPMKKNTVAQPAQTQTASKSYNTEKILTTIYSIRDSLIDSFSLIDYDSTIGKNLTENINRLGSVILTLGGEVEKFDPMEHISDLQMPSLNVEANKVIETSKTCYKIKNAKIEEAQVDDENNILITFAGKKDNMEYKAKGKITPLKSWAGNLAITYIYSQGSGKFFVKAFEDDRWIDKSQNFDISWELDETDVNQKIKEENQNIVKNSSIDIEKDLEDEDLANLDFNIIKKE